MIPKMHFSAPQYPDNPTQHLAAGSQLMPGWVQSACVGGWFSFLLLWCLPKTPVSSIPPLLFLIALYYDWHGVKNLFCQYQVELGLILGALILGIVFSSLPEKSVKGVYDFLRGGLIFFPTIFLARNYGDLIISWFPWAVGLACLVFLAGYIGICMFVGDDIYRQRELLEYYFGHYNHFGTGTALVGLLGLAVPCLLPVKWPARIAMGLVALTCLGLTLFSGSRGSVLALLVGLGFFIFMLLRRWRWLIFFGGGGLVAVFLGLLYLDILPGVGGSWDRGGNFAAFRFEIYSGTLHDTLLGGKFLGFGINTFKYQDLGQVLPFQLIMPHSVPIELFYSLGLIGSSFMVAACFKFGRSAIANGFEQSPLRIVGGCILVFILSRGAIDLKLWSVYFPALVSCGLGLMLSPFPPGQSVPVRREI